MKRIPRRIFVAGLGPREEFKREAIRLVNEQGRTIAEASRKLDVASKSLRTCANSGACQATRWPSRAIEERDNPATVVPI